MRIFRWIILAVLAGLTLVLLVTAVFTYQALITPPSRHSDQLEKRTTREPEAPQAINLIVQETGIATPCELPQTDRFSTLTWTRWQPPWSLRAARLSTALCPIREVVVTITPTR